MVHVFLSNRKSRLGKIFGFVCFTDISYVDLMINNLCDVWFGFYKMFASVPQVDRKYTSQHKIASQVEKQENSPCSYANVVRRNSANMVRGNSKFNQNKESTEVDIFIESGDIIIKNKKLACLVKAKDFDTLPNLGMLCNDEGFENFQIRYMGDLWEMLEFQSKEASKNFLSSDAVNHWITKKLKWVRNFVSPDRIAWVVRK